MVYSSAQMYEPGHFFPAQLKLSRQAIQDNYLHICEMNPRATTMAVVKADAYGHGLFWAVDSLLAVGGQWFGVAQLDEAMKLRSYLDEAGCCRPQCTAMNHLPDPDWEKRRGHLRENSVKPPLDTARTYVLSWMYNPEEDLTLPIESDIDLAVGQINSLKQVAKAAQKVGRRARIHIKVDTGMGRGGFTKEQLIDALSHFQGLIAHGLIEVVAVFSHLSSGDDSTAEAEGRTAEQIRRYQEFVDILVSAGVPVQMRHLSATSGLLWHPEAHFDMVRVGIGLYGLSPNPSRANSQELGLRPVMELSARLMLVKRLAAGETVSYGATWSAPTARYIGVVPLGYADGIPRQGSGKYQVWINGNKYSQVGRICMDQFMVDLGPAEDCEGSRLPAPAAPGEQVVLFGDPALGYPSADDWAAAADTINYTIITQIGSRIPRVSE